ncbi:MAG: ImmA/IrrE family metallo-endopeptidase [Clostridiales bacterium]|nr:ImmA/IrrE family metallo-endopeptidase [Clostridiales bacterium]
MKNLNDIFKIINTEKIAIEEVEFKNNIDGIYLKIPDLDPIIGIRSSIVNDNKKYISTLAEELGHHFTSIGNLTSECFTYSNRIIRTKQEYKARKWAANFLINTDDIILALSNSITSINELSDYFSVSSELIEIKIKSLQQDKSSAILLNCIKDNEILYNQCLI